MSMKSIFWTAGAVIVGLLLYDMVVSRVLKVNAYERD
jgi:hypothetical protein